MSSVQFEPVGWLMSSISLAVSMLGWPGSVMFSGWLYTEPVEHMLLTCTVNNVF